MKLDDVDLEDNLIKDLRLSFSRVSEFDRLGPRTLIDRKKVEAEYLDFGNLVDDMLQPDFNINNNYYVFDGQKPTAMLGDLCEFIINSESVINIDNEEDILEVIKKLGLWKTVKDHSKLLAKFTEEAKAYVRAMTTKGDRTLVTTLLVQEAEEWVSVLKTHEHTKDFFKKDLIHQERIEFRIGNFNFLSLLDYIDIDHENKTIQCIDLKSGSKSVSEFLSNFIKFRYYLQEAVYKSALHYYAKVNKLEGYKVLPFKFLYCGRYQKIPYFLEVSDKWNVAARYGFKTQSGYSYKGLYELLDDIEWHWRNEIFNMSKEEFESQGNLLIKDDFIELN